GEAHAASGPGTAPPPASGGGGLRDLPLQDLVRRVADDTKALLRQELALAGSEMGGKLKTAGKGAGLLGAAGIVGVFAACALVAGLILGVATVVAGWVAGLAVTLLLAAVGGLFAVRGRKAVGHATPLVPERAMEALSATRSAVTDAWRAGTHQAGTHQAGTPTEGGRTIRLADAPEAPAAPWRPKSPPRY
ncbi:MAG: phage holin family protein, partial [Actinomycetota bacterium]